MTRKTHDYTNQRRDVLVCAPTREEHDMIVAARGRPFTDDGFRPVALAPEVNEQPSLIDTYLAELRRAIVTDRAVNGGGS